MKHSRSSSEASRCIMSLLISLRETAKELLLSWCLQVVPFPPHTPHLSSTSSEPRVTSQPTGWMNRIRLFYSNKVHDKKRSWKKCRLLLPTHFSVNKLKVDRNERNIIFDCMAWSNVASNWSGIQASQASLPNESLTLHSPCTHRPGMSTTAHSVPSSTCPKNFVILLSSTESQRKLHEESSNWVNYIYKESDSRKLPYIVDWCVEQGDRNGLGVFYVCLFEKDLLKTLPTLQNRWWKQLFFPRTWESSSLRKNCNTWTQSKIWENLIW